MYVVGLTGGIGSGKSTVAKILMDLGIEVLDADVAARTVVEPYSPALDEIASHFGKEIIFPNGQLDRKALRSKVFGNDPELKWLESLLHPLIRQLLEEQLQKARSPYAVLESPLLLETNQHELANRILVVDAPEETQIQRALARDGGNEQEIRSIISAQMSREQRLALADDVILNDRGTEELESRVLSLHRDYLQFSGEQQ